MPGQLSVTDAIKLRLLEETDAEELHALIEANRAQLARWLPWAEGQGFEDTLDFIRNTRSQASDNDGFQTAIVRSGDIVGMVGYPGVDWANRSTRVGYWLDDGHQGRGIVTAAVRVLVDHALTVWQLNRVEIHASVENRRSRAIPERLGFREEGTLWQYQLVNGRYLDCVVYATLAADDREASASILGIDHVQVAAPVECEEDARGFYGELLGLPEIEKPKALQGRGGVWFTCGAQQLHVGVTDDFSPATKAHPALRVSRADLDPIAERLAAAGSAVRWDDAIPGTRRFYTADPWGNRVELLAAD
ncbi:MAG TPA: GNAT family N-acetyltransferase [Solirubrobacteraceae bacterium]|nr:GNAT family N-acetyltransferase [Solirubrobacteraceae bacterium]